MKMGKRTAATLGVVLMTVLLAGAATAAQPIREPLLIEDDVLTLCSFPVLLEVIANKEYVTFFEDGRLLVTGKLFVRLTNLADPSNSLTLNISGPAHISDLGERYAGRGLFLLFPEDVGGPGLVLTTGRVDVVRAEDGFVTNFSVKGNTVDICAALA
jgi:hypothetical protein